MEDNIRTHLAIANQQRASISGAIINLHGFVIGTNGVVWSSLIVAYISIGAGLPSFIFLGSVVSALTIGLWRYYVQYLDDQITHLYPEIILYECLSSVTERLTGVRAHLNWNCSRLNSIFTSGLSPEQQATIVKTLVCKKSIGNRGHWPFNLIGIVSISLFLAGSIWSVVRINAVWEWYYFASIFLIAVGLFLVIRAWIKGQNDPDEKTVTDLIPRKDEDLAPRAGLEPTT